MSSRILSPRAVAITSSACMRLVNELNPRTGVGRGGRGRHRRHKLKSIAVVIAAAYLVATILSCSSTSLLCLLRLSTLSSREEPLTRLVNRVVQVLVSGSVFTRVYARPSTYDSRAFCAVLLGSARAYAIITLDYFLVIPILHVVTVTVGKKKGYLLFF